MMHEKAIAAFSLRWLCEMRDCGNIAKPIRLL